MDRKRYAKREWYCEKAGDKTGKNPGGQWREISGNIRHGECGDVDLAEIHACRELVAKLFQRPSTDRQRGGTSPRQI